MKARIIFDKDSINGDFFKGWGVSFLIDNDILFDTGENFDYLNQNFSRMGVDLRSIKKIVISHEHWDHTSGLWEIIKDNKDIIVYGCLNFSDRFKNKVKAAGAKLVMVKDFCLIGKNIYSSGEVLSNYKGANIPEQSLVILTDSDVVLVCGCAHAGILDLIGRVQDSLNKQVTFVLGGLHLLDKDRRTLDYIVKKMLSGGVRKIAPSHCTGYDAVFLLKEYYKDNYIEVKAGGDIEI
ncbi:MAG: MBL fold metallo-hydrolase [Candidatus Omnitrophota bacterium]